MGFPYNFVTAVGPKNRKMTLPECLKVWPYVHSFRHNTVPTHDGQTDGRNRNGKTILRSACCQSYCQCQLYISISISLSVLSSSCRCPCSAVVCLKLLLLLLSAGSRRRTDAYQYGWCRMLVPRLNDHQMLVNDAAVLRRRLVVGSPSVYTADIDAA